MNINIYGSTGIIGTKSLSIIDKYFLDININLLCANNNVTKLIKQSYLYSPKYVYLNNHSKIAFLKDKINPSCKILNYDELNSYLIESKSDYSILAISGYKSLNYLEQILKNTSSLGLVSKEAVVSAGHLFKKNKKNIKTKIYPLDSEHFSIFQFLKDNNYKNLKKLTLTASGGPFLGKKYSSLSNVSFKQASTHPKWKMGYKNSIDSATLSNKCLELVEAHYLFDIPFNKLDIIIHPESKIHSIFEFKNYIYNMVGFQNDMTIPIYHYLNQQYSYDMNNKKFLLDKNSQFNFKSVKYNEFPIYKLFNKIDKTNPSNIIKFNVANEYAVNLFKNNAITYTDIYRIVAKISCLNLNYKLKNIKEVVYYHQLLERKINENKSYYI